MNEAQIIKFLSLGESQTIEFKAVCRADIVGRNVCAFLNSRGGYVVCGITDDGEPVGIADAEAVAIRVEKALIKSIVPKTLFSVEVQQVNDVSVVIIEVPEGKDYPYSFNNDIYIREGERTLKADVETIRDMIMRRQIEPERWERRFSIADVDDDIAVDEIRSAVRDAEKTSRIDFRNAENPMQVLEDFSVLKYGKVTNAGDVLFGMNTAQRYPQVRVRAAAFPTDKADNEYNDIKSVEGPLVSVLRKLENFIVQNTPTIARFRPDSLQRENDPLYPREAVREGLVNALAHRDYSSFSGNISVFIYPKRLEIINSGGFPEGVTAENMKTGHLSVLRNPDIAHVLYLRDLMEKLGRGSILIHNELKNKGLPPPQWREDEAGNVILTFRAPQATPQATGEVTGEVTGEATGEATGEVAGEIERLVLVTKGEMKRVELQYALSLKHQDYFREAYLLPAISLGLIEMTIPDKPKSPNQRYRLTAKGKQLKLMLEQGDEL